MRKLLSIGAAIALVSCVGPKVELASGGNPPDAGGSPSRSSPADGTWRGYVESFQFPSGSDTITLALATQADGSLGGTVSFGDKPPPPPPTNPDVGYPPGFNSKPMLQAIEGFAYTAGQVSFEGDRLRFGVSTVEVWKAWCGLQQAQLDTLANPPMYTCFPGSGLAMDGAGNCFTQDPTTHQSVPVDCGRALSSFNCKASATSCTVDMSRPDVSFDMQLAGSHLDGSAATDAFVGTTDFSSTPHLDGRNIHLTKQ